MTLRTIVLQLYRHPATLVFAACWLTAAAWFLPRGRAGLVLESAAVLAGCLLFCALTLRLTEPPALATRPDAGTRRRLCLQVLILLLVAMLTAWDGLYYHGVTAQAPKVPVWTDLVDWGGKLGQRYLDADWVGSPYHAVANPLRYCVVPLLLLVPLSGLRYLGLSRGHRVLRMIALWCAIPLGALAFSVLTGELTPLGLAKRFVHNTLVNGPFEEFLWRGAIQTRLAVLIGPAWGVALSSLGFGVWHLGLGFRQMGSQSMLDGLAVTILSQAVLGLAYAVIYQRTRNLVASSTCHVVFNSAA